MFNTNILYALNKGQGFVNVEAFTTIAKSETSLVETFDRKGHLSILDRYDRHKVLQLYIHLYSIKCIV